MNRERLKKPERVAKLHRNPHVGTYKARHLVSWWRWLLFFLLQLFCEFRNRCELWVCSISLSISAHTYFALPCASFFDVSSSSYSRKKKKVSSHEKKLEYLLSPLIMIFLNILRRAALSVLQLLLHSIAENRTPRHTVDHLRNKKFIYQFAQKKRHTRRRLESWKWTIKAEFKQRTLIVQQRQQ